MAKIKTWPHERAITTCGYVVTLKTFRYTLKFEFILDIIRGCFTCKRIQLK